MSSLLAALATVVVFSGAIPTIAPEAAWLHDVKQAGGLTFELIDRQRQLSEPAEANIRHRHNPDTADVERWRPLVAAYWPPETVDRALCIMKHESHGKPTAANPTSSARGLFQIMRSVWAPIFDVTEADLFDPETNVMLAARIYRLQGWQAWEVWNQGRCR